MLNKNTTKDERIWCEHSSSSASSSRENIRLLLLPREWTSAMEIFVHVCKKPKFRSIIYKSNARILFLLITTLIKPWSRERSRCRRCFALRLPRRVGTRFCKRNHLKAKQSRRLLVRRHLPDGSMRGRGQNSRRSSIRWIDLSTSSWIRDHPRTMGPSGVPSMGMSLPSVKQRWKRSFWEKKWPPWGAKCWGTRKISFRRVDNACNVEYTLGFARC